MAIDLQYDAGKKILRVTATGFVGLDEFRETMERITSGQDYASSVPTIWDVRRLDFERVDPAFAEAVRTARAEFTGRGSARIAYVVADPLGFGIMRMLQALTDTADPRESMVTYDYAEAEAWLLGEARGPRTA